MPITNARDGRIARLHRADRLDEEEHSITLLLIRGVYSSGLLLKQADLFYRNVVCLKSNGIRT